MGTPQIRLVGLDGTTIAANTLPAVGLTPIAGSLPVVLAQGVDPVQSFVSVPKFDPTSAQTIATSIVQLVTKNINRRYLKILNNGQYDLELWTGQEPTAQVVGQAIPQGEILYAQGGLIEVGERISVIYATSFNGPSGVVILEG